MKKIINVFENKTLKLKNVISIQINDLNEMVYNIDMLYKYIKTKGIKVIGPKISYVSIEIDKSGLPMKTIRVFQQLDGEINNVETPYIFDKEMKIEHCLYARYVGNRQKMNIVHQKLIVYAYENEILLKEGYYNVILKDDEEQAMVDVFMQCE